MSKNSTGTIFFIKLLISVIITLIILILIKASSDFKNSFYKHVYSDNISFTYLKSMYEKYIGDTKIFDKVVKVETVFNENMIYKSKEKYLDGVKLEVDKNYLVPINESGIVVFIGEKEGYGNTVIIQRIDGIDEWYGNVDNVNIKLYDYVKKGELLGEVSNTLYLVYKKDGKVLGYEEYIE
jgi:stage IV sporulation protein FA